MEGLSEEFYDPDQDEGREEDLTGDWDTLAGSLGARYERVTAE
jgi:hypothetical protein